MFGQLKPERQKRLDPHPESGTCHNRVGVDPAAVAQLDGDHMAVIIRNDARHGSFHDVHSRSSEDLELRIADIDSVVEHDREPVSQLSEQSGSVKPHGVGDDLHDATVAHLETVTERTVDDIATPVFCEAVDLGELVDRGSPG